MEAFSEDTARPFVLALVKRQARRFSAYPQIDRKDLAQEIMMAARHAWATAPAGLALSTCIYRAGRWRLNTIHRGLQRQKKRDADVAREQPGYIAAPPSTRNEYDAEDLTEWLSNVHRMIRRNFTTYGIPLRLPKARKSYMDRAQAAALLALKRRNKLTCRGARALLLARPNLARAIGLPCVPGYKAFSRMEKSVSLIQFSFRSTPN